MTSDRGDLTQSIADIAQKSGGVVTTAQAEATGVPRARLSEMVAVGELERVARGVYCLPEEWADEYLVAQLRFPKGTFSDDSALFLHGLSDRTPERLTMTFPRSYNATKARESGIEVRTCADGVLALGATTVRTPYGNDVRAYDAERTLCDMVRGRSQPDAQVVTPAFRAYARGAGRDAQRLLRYARELGVEAKVRTYLEVLL